MIIILIIGWIIFGIFAYAITLADQQGEYKSIREKSDVGFSILMGLFGPIGFLISFLLSGFAKHGLQWTSLKPEDEGF